MEGFIKLLERAVNGDKDAVTAVYQAVRSDLERLAHCFLQQRPGVRALLETQLISDSGFRRTLGKSDTSGGDDAVARRLFISFAAKCMTNAIDSVLRRRLHELSQIVEISGSALEAISDKEKGIAKVKDALEGNDLLARAFASLRKEDALLIRELFFGLKSQEEIAIELGISATKLSAKKKQILKRMREVLGDDDFDIPD